jgi:hypothetical protein
VKHVEAAIRENDGLARFAPLGYTPPKKIAAHDFGRFRQ